MTSLNQQNRGDPIGIPLSLADRPARIVLTDEVQLLHQVSKGYLAMTITIDAVYENGILKLDRPLPLKEHEKVRVTVEQSPSLTEQTAGMIGWAGDVETFERILKEGEETQYS